MIEILIIRTITGEDLSINSPFLLIKNKLEDFNLTNQEKSGLKKFANETIFSKGTDFQFIRKTALDINNMKLHINGKTLNLNGFDIKYKNAEFCKKLCETVNLVFPNAAAKLLNNGSIEIICK